MIPDATVAQSVEQLIRNQQAAGSSPASSSKTRLQMQSGFLDCKYARYCEFSF